jgi:hypothetical protein
VGEDIMREWVNDVFNATMAGPTVQVKRMFASLLDRLVT